MLLWHFHFVLNTAESPTVWDSGNGNLGPSKFWKTHQKKEQASKSISRGFPPNLPMTSGGFPAGTARSACGGSSFPGMGPGARRVGDGWLRKWVYEKKNDD